MLNTNCSKQLDSDLDQLCQKQNDFFDNNNLNEIQQHSDNQLASIQQASRISNQDLNSVLDFQFQTINTLSEMSKALQPGQNPLELDERLLLHEQLKQMNQVNKQTHKFIAQGHKQTHKLIEELKQSNKQTHKLIAQGHKQTHKLIEQSSKQTHNLIRQTNSELKNLVKIIHKLVNKQSPSKEQILPKTNAEEMKYNLSSYQGLKSIQVIQQTFKKAFADQVTEYPMELFKFFHKKFKPQLPLKMMELYQIYTQQLGVVQLNEIESILPFCYFILCNQNNYAKFVSKEGAATIQYCKSKTYFNQQNQKFVNNDMIDTIEEHQKEYRDYFINVNFYISITDFIDQLGYQEFTSNQNIVSIFKRHIINLFLAPGNLWSSPKQLFMALILRLFKCTCQSEYEKLVKVTQQSKYVDMGKTMEIIKNLDLASEFLAV